MDIQALKDKYDLRVIVREELGKPVTASARYDLYKCPLHHEKKGASLQVWANGWKCYGACNVGGDIFTWLKMRRNLEFKQAVEFLGGGTVFKTDGSIHRRHNEVVTPSQPPGEAWQHYAKLVTIMAVNTLNSHEGEKARAYLESRGIPPSVIKEAQLGYVPARDPVEQKYGRVLFPDWTKADGKPVRIPCGITIPHWQGTQLWAVRVRRSTDPKYMSIAGGSKALYWSDHVWDRAPILICEGEFDCLIAWHCSLDISPVAIASASNADINPYWYPSLLGAPSIYARFDEDDAGNKAYERLRSVIPHLQRLTVPEGKDINEFYCLRGSKAVDQWLMEALDVLPTL